MLSRSRSVRPTVPLNSSLNDQKARLQNWHAFPSFPPTTIRTPMVAANGTWSSFIGLFQGKRFRPEECAMTEPTDIGRGLAVTSRRQLLRKGGALVGGAVVAGSLTGSKASAATENAANLPPNVPEWMKTPGDPMGSQLYGTPSPFEKGVIKNIPKDLTQYLSASGRTP